MTFATNQFGRITTGLSAGTLTLIGDTDVGVSNGTFQLRDPSNPNTENLEWVRFTSKVVNADSTVTYTLSLRSLSLTAIPATSTGNGSDWGVETIYTLVAMHDELTNDLYGTEVLGFTTAQRNAIVVPSGQSRIILNTDSGVLEQYIGGTWTTFATGTVVNASTTVAGKVQEATDANIASATEIGSSGAPLAVNPKSTSTTAVAGKIPVLDSNGTVLPFISNYGITGELKIWTTAAAPTGWLLAQGQAVSRTTYAPLFSVIGTTYGVGDGSTTFNIPDMRGNVPVGYKSADTNFGTLGGTAGSATHTMSSGEMPAHTHNVAYNIANGTYSNAVPAIYASATSYGNVATSSAGSGTAFNIVQPSLTINYIIKI